jgi:GMP synthase (glutamine-hydrolysing)
MSHGDKVADSRRFSVTASTPSCPFAAVSDETRRFYGVQFHPEVTHTAKGAELLSNFVHKICGCRNLWNLKTSLICVLNNYVSKLAMKKFF